MNKQKKKKRKIKKLRLLILIVSLLIVASSPVLFYLHNKDGILNKHVVSVEEQLNELYQDIEHTRFSNTISSEKIETVKNAIVKLKDSEKKEALLEEIEITETLYVAYDSVKSMLNENVIVNDVQQKDINRMQEKLAKAGNKRKAFLPTIKADTLNILQQFQDIEEAYRKISDLFQEDGITLKESITTFDVQGIQNHIAVIRNQNTLSLLNAKLDEIHKKLDQREQKLEEAKQKELATKQAYVVLDVPLINQTAAGAPQGCEAASLLMALRYKGIALDLDYHDFIDGMPVADDPNYGFVHSQYDNEPTDVPHAIYPAPLAEYGRKFGNVLDISGATPEQLRQEIYHGNPVVLYIVSGFDEPIWVSTSYGKNILNMHVVTLIGYNDNLQKYLINDPYWGSIWVSYDTVNASYQTRNYAVSVR